jgi:hypothetical protein
LLVAVRRAVPEVAVPMWVWVTAVLVGVVAAGLCVAATAAALGHRPMRGLLLSATATVLSLSCALCCVLPNAQGVWISRRVADAMLAADATGRVPMAAWEFHEDSLIFNTRGRVVRVEEDGGEKRGLREFLAMHADQPVLVALIEVRNGQQRDRLAQLVTLAGSRGVREVARESGFNYSHGSRVTVVIARVEPEMPQGASARDTSVRGVEGPR